MISLANIFVTLLASSPAGIDAISAERVDPHGVTNGIIETSLNIAQSMLLPNAMFQAKSNLSSHDDGDLWRETEQTESTNTWIVQQEEIHSEIPLQNTQNDASPNMTLQPQRRHSNPVPASERKIRHVIDLSSKAQQQKTAQRHHDVDSKFSELESSVQARRYSSRSRIPTNSNRDIVSRRW